MPVEFVLVEIVQAEDPLYIKNLTSTTLFDEDSYINSAVTLTLLLIFYLLEQFQYVHLALVDPVVRICNKPLLYTFTEEQEAFYIINEIFHQRLFEIRGNGAMMKCEQNTSLITAASTKAASNGFIFKITKPRLTGEVIGLQKASLNLISSIVIPRHFPQFQMKFGKESNKEGIIFNHYF